MVRNFEDVVLTGKEPNPIEHAYLATGILFGRKSRSQGQTRMETPRLNLRYQA